MRLYSKLIKYIENIDNISLNGVYKIYHLSKPHLVYIGSTCRSHKKQCKKGMYGRWVEHYSDLKNGKHHSIYLQRTINKYGFEGLRFEVIYFSDEDSVEVIRTKETEYISLFNSYKEGYNSCETVFVVFQSEETRKNTSDRMKVNNPMFDATTVNKVMLSRLESFIPKYILQYTLVGEFVKKYKNSEEASVEVGVDCTNINRAANGITKKSANYIWIFEEEFSKDLLENKVKAITAKRVMSKETVQKRSNTNSKPVIVTELERLEEMEFLSIKQCANYLGLDPPAVSKCCNGIQKRVKNYNIRFK